MRVLIQLAILVTLVTLKPWMEPARPALRPALLVDPQRIKQVSVSWEGKRAEYRLEGEAFDLVAPKTSQPPPLLAAPGTAGPSFEGLSSPVPAAERRRARIDRLVRNLVASLTRARVVEIKEAGGKPNDLGLDRPMGQVKLEPGGPGLDLGELTPSRTGRYARPADGGTTLVVPLTTLSTWRQLAEGDFPLPDF